MSKYYKLAFNKHGFNVPVEVDHDTFSEECRKHELKCVKRNIHFESWLVPGTRVQMYGIPETNMVYGFILN